MMTSRSRSRNIGVKVQTSHPCRQRDRMRKSQSYTKGSTENVDFRHVALTYSDEVF